MSYFGLTGLVLILLGWVIETAQTIKKGKTNLPLFFSLTYGIGALLLTIHSLIVNDLIFLALNVAATAIALINVFYALNDSPKGPLRNI